MKKLLAGSVLGLLAAACGSGGENVGKTREPLQSLVPLQGCGEVESYIRERMSADINARIDASIKRINESTSPLCSGGETYEDAGASYGSSSNGSSSSGSPSPGPSGSSSTPPPTSSTPSSSSSDDAPTSTSPSTTPAAGSTSSDGTATESSGTNNQVAGVDEADFVKNDGQYLYFALNGALRIVRAFPPSEAGAVAKIDLGGAAKELFVEGNRAVVYVAVPNDSSSSSASSYGGSYASTSCTYGYDCVPSGDGTRTKLMVFDITDRANPVKLRELQISGSLLAARRIGNAVHTVVIDAPQAQNGAIDYYPTNVACSYDDPIESQKATYVAAYEEVRQKDLALVAAMDVMGNLPTFTENGASAAPACAGYYRPSLGDGRSFTSIISLDLDGGPATTSTVVSDPGVVYASETSLFMAVPHERQDGAEWYDAMPGENEASTVHQFRIGEAPSLTGYEASGIVKGRVLNQFSLDEFEEHLRIATSTSQPPDPSCHSTMTVLEKQGEALVQTGIVDHIAPTEDIRSVRFDGSRGYVVTFKKTDPLYVFDLGNPYAPSISGELQIPGFSTYMHMMDAAHLLTIGYDAQDEGDFAWFAGVRLQIFDVSDMKSPQLAHSEVIGTRGSSSEALSDHLAFNYFAPKNLLALPMTICEGGDGGGYGTNMTFAGLIVYDATVANGFQLKGKVSHPQTTSGGYDDSACSNWWTQASTEVKRSVVMDDFVYSISNKRVKINALANLSTDIAEISLEN